MIVLLDPLAESHIHEEANAGVLKLINENVQECIVYIGEKKHVHCVKKLYRNHNVLYRPIKEICPYEKADLYRNTSYYLGLINNILKIYNPDKLFIMYGLRPCILATEIMSKRYAKVKFYFIVHAMMEPGWPHAESYKKLIKISSICNNLHFVTYSPYCTGDYWGVKNEKFIFIHLFYIDNGSNDRIVNKTNQKTTIGIIGACANLNAKKIINLVNHKMRNDRAEYEFWVASSYYKRLKGLSNTVFFDSDFERGELKKRLQDVDYLLIPYSKADYTVSASGVLWDAVSNKIPCLMLNSRYLNYYMRYNIGYQENSIPALCDRICELLRHPIQQDFFVGIEMLDQENIRIVKSII